LIEFKAVYYDGASSLRRVVAVRRTAMGLHIAGDDVEREVPLSAILVDAPIPGAARSLGLPGGALLQTGDHAAIEALFPRAHRLEGWVHGLEQHWRYALGAAVVVALFAWWLVVYGVPLAAQLAAGAVPLTLEAKLGEQTLSALERPLCKPSALAAGRQEQLRKRFELLTAGLDDGYAYRLELRECRIGPNALALPGGIVVMTDDLVKLARHDDQISAVLAHEIGHVRHRHGVRLGLQAAGVAALSAALLGDAVSITSLVVTLPTVLLQTGYSRDFETEADDYAFERLRSVGISPRAFAEMMELFQMHFEGRSKGKRKAAGDEALDYFSTHPATARRIERALKAAGP
jgi:Zn-dependent protease with chaperone function